MPAEPAGRPALRRVVTTGRTLGRRAAWPVGSVVSVRSARRVVLTYDDGPEPGGTDGVLAALADAGVQATFFVLLTRARRYPGLLAEVVAAGHEIGLHGTDHRPLPDFQPREVRRRCVDGRAELEDRIGAEVRWMRPPYGRQTIPGWAAVRSAGLLPVLWGPSTADSQPRAHADRVALGLAGAAGSILLAHDGFAGPDDGVDDGPAPVLDRGRLAADVIAGYRERGLAPCSLGAAVAESSARREAVFVG